MKTLTKVLLVLFIAAAVGLYVFIYVIPEAQGKQVKTSVLEYGDLPVTDTVTMILVRDETLYRAAQSGAVSYKNAEGTKVRKGVSIISIERGAAGEATSSAIDDISERAGDDAEKSEGGTAAFTAVVSYFADGYEKQITPGRIEKMDKELTLTLPRDGTDIKREYVDAGNPVYKLTDNNLWYMVYWMSGNSDERTDYETGASVKVDFGTTTVSAKIEDIVAQGDDYMVVLRSDIYYKELAEHRVVAADVIFAEYKGLICENSSLAFRDEQSGVFVKQRSGSFKWVPVKIIKTVLDRCILEVLTYDDDDGKTVSTVNYYDEVLTNPGAEGYK
jgi:putative membrane fusion protein